MTFILQIIGAALWTLLFGHTVLVDPIGAAVLVGLPTIVVALCFAIAR